MGQSTGKTSSTQTLGEYLAAVRTVSQLSLRDVEQATNKLVSNAYLSQLEKDKIGKPSPNILHALASAYKISYEELMARAGYVSSDPAHARAATFSLGKVTPDEQRALTAYLTFLRSQKKK